MRGRESNSGPQSITSRTLYHYTTEKPKYNLAQKIVKIYKDICTKKRAINVCINLSLLACNVPSVMERTGVPEYDISITKYMYINCDPEKRHPVYFVNNLAKC